MTAQRDMRRDLAVALAGILLGSASVLTWGDTRPEVVDNQRVNQIDGPDPNDPVDDDDPNDQAHTKGQWETTVSLIRAPNGSPLKLFAAWIDQSWLDADPNQVLSTHWSIGFAVSEDVHGGWEFHDLARSRDGYAASGYLPPPDAGNPPRWKRWQFDPVSPASPPNSAITGSHLVGVDGDQFNGRIFYASSPDGESDWEVQAVYPEQGLAMADKPFVSVYGPALNGKPKYVFITWLGDYGLSYAVSSNAGGDFTLSAPEYPLHSPGALGRQYTASAFAPGTAEGPYVYVVWWERFGTAPAQDKIVWRRGLVSEPTPGEPSIEWVPPLGTAAGVVADINRIRGGVTGQQLVNFRVLDQPSIAVDHTCAREGWVYVCYVSEVPPGAADPNTPCDSESCQPDIFVSRYMFDEGDPNNIEWDVNSVPVRVNDDDPAGTLRTVQVMPWIAVDDVGHLGVGFYDRRDDAENNRLQHYYFAHSRDGAKTFQDNMAVSTVQSNTYPTGGGGVFIGDYTTIAGANNSFYAVWCDTRNWDPNTEPARIGDIYFAEIEMAVPPDLDWDCDVDLTDFSLFGQCFGGADNPPPPECPVGVNADFDNDCDVDLGDFALFAQCFSGADNPPAPNCPWQGCGGGGGGGEAAACGGQFDVPDADDPTIEDLYRWLYEYCEGQGIPFT